MPGKVRSAVGNPGVVIREEVVGQAPAAICYPNISSCITITCVAPAALSGAHLTVATGPELIDQMLLGLKSAGANMFQAVYVVGKIAEFKARTKDERMGTRKKMSQLLRGTLKYKDGTVFFHDTALYGDANIGVTKTLLTIDFCWQNNRTKVQGDVMPNLGTYTPIPRHVFIRR